jgi:hemolysin activation/secretion protein
MNKISVLLPSHLSVYRPSSIVFGMCALLLSAFAALAQGTNSKVEITQPEGFNFDTSQYSQALNKLRGLPATDPKVAAFAKQISDDIRKKGYTFAIVLPTTSSAGNLTLNVLPGRTGQGAVSGNEWLTDKAILNSMSWESGRFFNYSSFQAYAANLNSNRFINVDSKLQPKRSKSQEIVVDGDFKVKDEIPLVYTASVANDGTDKSSGWRASAGVEWWMPVPEVNKATFNWLTDPDDISSLNSYSGMLSGVVEDNWNWILFAGYSESEYNDVIMPGNLDIYGEGTHAGVFVTHPLADYGYDNLTANIGFTYLDLANSISTNIATASLSKLDLFVPRIGIQGVIKDHQDIPGRSVWSLSLFTDLGSSDDKELDQQRSGSSSGFFALQGSISSMQELPGLPDDYGLFLNASAQLAADALPISLQKSIGGADSVRGYDEREAFGDHGFHLNSELRMGSYSFQGLTPEDSIQPYLFYDIGFVKSKISVSGSSNSTDMHSIGAGFKCQIKPAFTVGFDVGIPLVKTPDTDRNSGRVHFDLDFRF